MKKILTFITLTLLVVLVGCQGEVTKAYTINYISDNQVFYFEEVKANTAFLPSEKPIKEGYEFGGWYYDENFNFQMSAYHLGVNSDLTLYAKWNLIEEEEEAFDIETWLIENKDFINSLIDVDFEGSTLTAKEIIELMNEAQQKLIEDVNQAIVKIDIVSGVNKDSGGSGVIYKKTNNTYYVLTNEHVTEGSSSGSFEITVFSGTQTKTYKNVTKVNESKAKDLAILKFDTTDTLKVIEFEDEANIKKGQMVYAMGSPVWFDDVVTQGVVSIPKINDYDDYQFDAYVIMHSAAINPGNSGGALINVYGKLVGINAYSYPMYDEETDLQLYNFAIHISEVNKYIVGKN